MSVFNFDNPVTVEYLEACLRDYRNLKQQRDAVDYAVDAASWLEIDERMKRQASMAFDVICDRLPGSE